jgi:molybdopterin-guanine dinucleotide biosynthesis protein B
LSSPPIVSIVGRSGAGKTTVLERLIAELTRRGLRVGALKHAHHGFDMDHEGKDTWRHRRAGARAVGIVSPTGVAVIRTLETELPVEQAAALLGDDLDLVLTEGFSQAQTPKIEVVRAELGCDIRTPSDQLVAVVADRPVTAQAPQVGFDDAPALADIIVGYIGSPR